MPTFKCKPFACLLLSFTACLFVAPQAQACYTVYNQANVRVYANMAPPIDMSYQIHERLPAVFPGGHLVFDASNDCPLIDARITVPALSNVLTPAKPAASAGSRNDRTMGK